jgi:hypothetical protein
MTEHAGDVLTVAETAKMLQRSTEQVRRYLREGVLPGRRLGGQWFVDRGDAEALLLRRQHELGFLRRLAASAPDPLGAVIAVGGSGGGDISAGQTKYLCALAGDR